jgi:hypothetical protein
VEGIRVDEASVNETINNERVSYEKLNYEPANAACLENENRLAGLDPRGGDPVPVPVRDAAGPIQPGQHQ